MLCVQEQREDGNQLQQRCDELQQQLTDARRQLDEMKLICDDNTTELQLDKANDSISQLRNQLDSAQRQVSCSHKSLLCGPPP